MYNANTEKLVCDICKEQSESNAKCINDHFICDSCHQSEAVDFIENYCVNTEKTNPMESVLEIMNNPKVKKSISLVQKEAIDKGLKYVQSNNNEKKNLLAKTNHLLSMGHTKEEIAQILNINSAEVDFLESLNKH